MIPYTKFQHNLLGDFAFLLVESDISSAQLNLLLPPHWPWGVGVSLGLVLPSPRNATRSLGEGALSPCTRMGGRPGHPENRAQGKGRASSPSNSQHVQGPRVAGHAQRSSALPEVHFPRSLPDAEPPWVTKLSGPRRTHCPPHTSPECLLCQRRVLGWTRVRTGLRGSPPRAPGPGRGRRV